MLTILAIAVMSVVTLVALLRALWAVSSVWRSVPRRNADFELE